MSLVAAATAGSAGATPTSVCSAALWPAGFAAAVIVASLLVGAVATPSDADAAAARTDVDARAASAHVQRGNASIYSHRFHNRRMANGERFDVESSSAAHRTLPLGTRVLVRNLENGRSATVTVGDRGPYVRGRIIDVSPRTAVVLGMRGQGVAPVEVVPIGVRGPDHG